MTVEMIIADHSLTNGLHWEALIPSDSKEMEEMAKQFNDACKYDEERTMRLFALMFDRIKKLEASVDECRSSR